MKPQKRSAFTLVEIMVTSVVLSTLVSTGGIGLFGYGADARDSKRISDVANITMTMSIEVTKGANIANLITSDTTNILIINTDSSVGYQGITNFVGLRQNSEDFQDPSGDDYTVGYSIGGEGMGAYKFYQAAVSLESSNDAHVVGNYYRMDKNDSPSVIKNGEEYVVNNGSVLPY